MNFIKRIIPYFRPYKQHVIIGLIFILIANAFQAASPWVLRLAINGLSASITYLQLWKYAALIIGVAIGSGIFRFLMRRTLITVSRHIEYDLRQSIFRHLSKLEPSFYDHSRIGDLMTRSTSDVEQVRMVVGPALMYLVNTVFGLIFGITLMLMISVKLTLFVAFVFPIVSFVVYHLGERIHVASTRTQEAFSDISSIAQENFAGIRVIKAFRQQAFQKMRFDRGSLNYMKRSIYLIIQDSIFIPLIMMIFGGAIAGILLMGGKLIIDGVLLIGDFVAFTSYLMILTWPMISVGWVVNLFQRGSASLIRINALLDRKPEARTIIKTSRAIPLSGRITFQDVSFAYPKSERNALTSISFDLPAGKTLGIVGKVGCGKSSIIALISRFYEGYKGQIFIDGISVSDIPVELWRANLGVVPQDALLFSTSILENITLGETCYTQAEINEAVEVSRLVQDLKDFPAGLQTEVGERGITLSGGQKQRVAIARAVIRKPPLILLDDPLSAVDAVTESAILANLKHYLKDRSAILVSNRASTVRDADEILVMKDSAVVERGRHETLLKLNGEYADLFYRERLARELEDVA